jgi:RNA polymerase-binding protein DksA
MATSAPKKSAPAGPAVTKKTSTAAAAVKKKSATPRGSTKKAAAKSSTQRTTATRSPAKETPTSPPPTPDKKVAVKTTPAPSETPAASSDKTAAKRPAKKLTVGAGESPWTAKELDELRGELERDAEHLRAEIHEAEEEIAGLLRDGGDGAGNDQADVGSTTFERDHEMSLANNARDMLSQIERALGRIEDGTYGVCESCGNPIGKGRLQAFPRATLCVSCKEREERR